MENQMEKKMENDMETREYVGVIWGYIQELQGLALQI